MVHTRCITESFDSFFLGMGGYGEGGGDVFMDGTLYRQVFLQGLEQCRERRHVQGIVGSKRIHE